MEPLDQRPSLRLTVEHGYSNQEIAAALSISLNSVKTYVRNVLAKASAPSLGSLRARFRK